MHARYPSALKGFHLRHHYMPWLHIDMAIPGCAYTVLHVAATAANVSQAP